MCHSGKEERMSSWWSESLQVSVEDERLEEGVLIVSRPPDSSGGLTGFLGQVQGGITDQSATA